MLRVERHVDAPHDLKKEVRNPANPGKSERKEEKIPRALLMTCTLACTCEVSRREKLFRDVSQSRWCISHRLSPVRSSFSSPPRGSPHFVSPPLRGHSHQVPFPLEREGQGGGCNIVPVPRVARNVTPPLSTRNDDPVRLMIRRVFAPRTAPRAGIGKRAGSPCPS